MERIALSRKTLALIALFLTNSYLIANTLATTSFLTRGATT